METIQESSPYQTRPSSRKKLDFTTLLDMNKQSEFSEKDLNNQKELFNTKNTFLNLYLSQRKQIYKKYFETQKTILSIQRVRTKTNQILEKNENMISIINTIEEIINKKKKNLTILSERISKFKTKNQNLTTLYIPNLIQMNKQITFINKAYIRKIFIEFSDVFFNKMTTKYLSFPQFYDQDFTQETSQMRAEFYQKRDRSSSLLFGYMINMAHFLSKKFNIILPYPIFYNGSKSSLIPSKKDNFVKFYITSENANLLYGGADSIENGTKYLQRIFSEIIGFFLKEGLIKNTEEFFSKEDEIKKNVFLSFIKLNNYMNTVIKENNPKHNINYI